MDDKQLFFQALNGFFEKIYVITLRRAEERHALFQKELEGLDYTVFYGQDRLEFSVEELERQNIYSEALARKAHRWNKPMPPGMIGCSWSHKLVYQDIIRNGYRNALIMEDDIFIDAAQVHVFSKALKELPAGWELLYLGYERNEEAGKTSFLKKWIYHVQRFLGQTRFTHRTIGNLYPRKVTEHIYTSGYHDHTHAYAVTLSGAEKLDRLQEPIRFFPDNLLAFAATNGLVRAYVIKPKLVYQLSQGEEKRLRNYIDD